MKKILNLFFFVLYISSCTGVNTPDTPSEDNQEGTVVNPTDTTGGGGNPGGGGETAKLKSYLVDVSISATESNHSKTVNTYFDNDDLKRTDYYQNGELNYYVEYSYSNNKRFGIKYNANGTIDCYDTIFYNSQKQQERTSLFYPDWTKSRWQVNTWEYSSGKMINHKYYVDGVLEQNGNYTYNGNYRYGNTIGYQSTEGEYYLKSLLDTAYMDAYDRLVSWSTKSYYEGNGVSTISYYSIKNKYLDDKSDRYSHVETIFRTEGNNNGNEYSTIISNIHEYTWVNETTRYGVTNIKIDGYDSSQSVSYDTVYYHLGK